MKLKELAIEGAGVRQNLRLGRFSDGLTLVYGERDAGKTTTRQFIRDSLLGVGDPTSLSGQTGQLNIASGGEELQLHRSSLNAPVELRSLSNISATDSTGTDGLGHLKSRINSELYETVFNVSFQETSSNFYRLGTVLKNQLGVPSGSGAAGDESEYLNWQQETAVLNDQIETMRSRLNTLNLEKSEYVRQIEAGRHAQHARVSEIEIQINQVVARISEIQSISLHDQLSSIEGEIAQLRSVIANAKPVVNFVKTESPLVAHRSMYQRLDDLDDQIRQWRRIQVGVQNQRVQLRDEMLIWNELTLESEQHPYHNSRAILAALESRVDEAERHANHWSEADVTRVDTSQLAQTHGEICRRMRDDLQGLCNELSQQYKHIRHRAAAAELKHLRRCYTELGENIDRLIERRELIVREIRAFDPAGADAIEQAEAKFSQCAQREGYYEARRQFVGQLTRQQVQPTYQAADMSAENSRLAALEQQRLEMTQTAARYESELGVLNSRHTELTRERNLIMGEFSFADLELKVQSVDAQIVALTAEMNLPLGQLEKLRTFVPAQPNELILRACELLSQFTDGDLNQVFLSDAVLATQGMTQVEFQVRDRQGKILKANSVDAGLQDQVYLSLMIAAKESLQAHGLDLPILLDDAFSRIPPERVTPTLGLLNELGIQGHQIIALTQHRYLADRLPGVTLLELSPPIPTIQPLVTPERQSPYSPMPIIAPTIQPRNETQHSFQATAFSSPYVAGREPNWQSTSRLVGMEASLARPYPLSKYPQTHSGIRGDIQDFSVAFPATGVVTEPTGSAPTGSAPSVSSVAVDKFADQLGFVTAISESTPLRKVGFFDASQLRNFDDHQVETVGDLLELDWSNQHTYGIRAEQLARWKGQLVLMITVPGMRINDARILVACGISEPEHLDTSHPQQLFERLQRFLGTTEGRRFASANDSISKDRIAGWYRALDATRSTWKNRRGSNRFPTSQESASSRTARTTGRERPQRAPRIYDRAPRVYDRAPRVYDGERRAEQPRSYEQRERPQYDRGDREPREFDRKTREPREPLQNRSARESRIREPRPARPPRMNTPRPERKTIPRLAPAGQVEDREMAKAKIAEKHSASPNQSKLKFYLDLSDHIEAAPSIGPKTAERFEKIGVSTVADFLKQTAESMATKIKYKRITEEVIRGWQHQARLICRIPNLRGHDAQLLVACGMTEPEELSTMQPKTLFEVIGPFAETKEGLKIIRNGKKPDLAEITDWISWSGHTRSLKAA